MIKVFAGSNHTRIKQEVEKLKQQFVKDHGEAGLQVIAADRLESEQFASYLTGSSLFASHKLLIIKNLSSLKDVSEQFLALSSQIPAETEVVLVEDAIDKRTSFYKELKKRFEVTEYGELSENELLKWIQQSVEQADGVISGNEARLLLRYVGSNQEQLQNEIDKLLAYDTQITRESIERLVEKQSEETVFQLLDASLSGNTSRALDILESLERAHTDPFAVANMLIWQAHIVAIAYAGKNKNPGEIAVDTKLKPYVLQNARSVAMRLSEPKMRQIIEQVAELDVKLKSSGGKPWRLIEYTILAI